MEKTLKNIVLAGIGSLAYTYEKASTLVDDLVKKGELTINQGKELNEELKRKMGKNEQPSQDDLLTVEKLKQVLAEINFATKDDLEVLKSRVSVLENQQK